MKILAFDTSTAQGSVAVLEDDLVLSERVWRRERSHSEFLTSEIQEALKEASVKIAAIDALAVGQGPGSFTGIRVAINAARSLGYALAKPVSVFETSEILAHPINRFDLPVLSVLNAQKNSYFVSRFTRKNDCWIRTDDVALLTLKELEGRLTEAHLCVGDGCTEAEARLSPDLKSVWVRDSVISDYPLASSLGALTFIYRDSRGPIVWNAVQPLYLRASGAEETLREKLAEVSKR